MASKVLSTEIKDFVIDCVLIINDVFRNILRTRIQPDQLQEKIHACEELKIGYFKLLPEQTAICCPHPHRVPDYDEFDVFLLYKLIRNLCPDLAPTDRWGEIPSDSNKEIGDDIERLRHIRYRLYAILETTVHPTAAYLEYTPPPSAESLESASHSTAEFLESTAHPKPELISRWLELKEALQRTGEFLNSSAENEKKIKIIEETYHFIKARGETPKEGEVLGKERKVKTDRREEEEDHDDEEEEEEEEEEEISEDILESFKKWFSEKYEKTNLAYCYYGRADTPTEKIQNGDEVLVAVIDNMVVIEKESFFRHGNKNVSVIWKDRKDDSTEESLEMEEEEMLQDQYIDKLEEIEKYLKEESEKLFKDHLNLEMIVASTYRIKRGTIVKSPCIVLYCSCKGIVPVNDSKFPTHINGVETDVREGFFHLLSNFNEEFCAVSKDQLNPLRMGASIGNGDVQIEGTLGGFVTSNGEDCFISCAHILYHPNEMENPNLLRDQRIVMQPSILREGSQQCGMTLRSVCLVNEEKITVEATLVKLTERHPNQLLFADLLTARLQKHGFSRDTFPRYIGNTPLDLRDFMDRKTQRGKRYLKCGTTTGLTMGRLQVNQFQGILRDSRTAAVLQNEIYRNQIVFKGENFADCGDSGAFVFQVSEDRLDCVGMIVGKCKDRIIVTPIIPVLNALNANLVSSS